VAIFGKTRVFLVATFASASGNLRECTWQPSPAQVATFPGEPVGKLAQTIWQPTETKLFFNYNARRLRQTAQVVRQEIAELDNVTKKWNNGRVPEPQKV
jgi:hypothetical protein